MTPIAGRAQSRLRSSRRRPGRATRTSRWLPVHPLVCAAIIRDPRAAVIVLDLTQVVDATLVKVMAWYDNDGFTHQMIYEACSTLGVAAA